MHYFRYVAFVIVGLASVQSLRAEMRVRLFDGYGRGSGGEFDVRFTQDSPGATGFSSTIGTKTWNSQSTRFSTFCLERDEFIGFNTEYRATIAALATGGGNNTNTGDALDPWTAYLYTQFATGQLSSFDYLPSFGGANQVREIDGENLQIVFWFLENELNVSGYGYNYDPHSADRAATAFGGTNNDRYRFWQMAQTANWTNIGSVRVLNLTGLDGSEKQSQLIMIPIPAAVLLGAIGTALLVVVRRRFV